MLAAGHESRRSTPVRLKVRIEAKRLTDPVTCERRDHCRQPSWSADIDYRSLRAGMRIQIYVVLTDKSALAQVVYVEPAWPRSVE